MFACAANTLQLLSHGGDWAWEHVKGAALAAVLQGNDQEWVSVHPDQGEARSHTHTDTCLCMSVVTICFISLVVKKSLIQIELCSQEKSYVEVPSTSKCDFIWKE